MLSSLAPFALGLALLGGASPPASLVASVREATKDDVDAPRDAVKLFRKVDINGDGLQDWRVDYSERMAWCGTGGCRQQLYLARPDGTYALVFDAQARGEFRLRKTRDGHRLDLEVHGSVCGKAGVEECLRSFLWNEGDARYVEIPNRNGDGRLEGLMPLVTLDPATYPKAVSAALAAVSQVCEAKGGKLGETELAVERTPDLDGDGRSDWLVDASLMGCVNPKDEDNGAIDIDAGLTLLTGDGASQALFLPIYAYVFDVTTQPATFIAVELSDDCGGEGQPACAETPYRWDPARRTLVPAPAARGQRSE